MKKDIWHIYIIRCKNNSLYTGITNDVNRRFLDHSNGKGAKYLRGKGPLKLEFQTEIGNKSAASKIEHQIKKLSKQKKEDIIREGKIDFLLSS